MKVLDIISEGIFGGYARKAVAEQIAKGWVKEIKLYKQEFGSIPKLDELMDIAPAEKLTAEKAHARDPRVQKAAYNEAVSLVKAEERELIKRGVGIAAGKAGNALLWLSWFAKWGTVVWGAFGTLTHWNEYKSRQAYAVKMLEKEQLTPEQFKTYHDRIFIAFVAQEAATIAAVIAAGGVAKFVQMLPLGNTVKFFNNLMVGWGAGELLNFTKQLSTPESAAKIVYLLTAQGMVKDGVELPPDSFGSAVENALTLYVAEDYFKKLALDAAKTGGQGDKIPPNLRPSGEKPAGTPAASPSAGSSSAAPSTAANDQDEEEPPVSGGLPQRPNQSGRPGQGSQPARTSSEWK